MKQWILIVAVILAVTGCQRRSFDEEGGRSDAFAIRFSVENTIQVEPGTKSDVNPSTVDLPAGSTVRVLAFNQDVVPGTDAPRANCTYIVHENESTHALELLPCVVNAAGEFQAFANAKAMELNNGTYDFYAYTPARKIESDSVTVKGIGHYLDFMSSGKITQAVSRSAAEVPLAFEHENAKITFVVKSAPEMSAKDSLWADSVILRNMGKLSAEFQLGGDLATTLGGLKDSCVVRSFIYNNTSDKTKGANGAEVILPKPAGKVSAEFYITVDKADYLLKATLPEILFGKGKNYKFTMQVKQGSVELYLNIVSWNYIVTSDSGMGDGGNILIGSWSNVDWSGEMGGNMDPVTGKIEIGSWTPIDIPGDFQGGHGGGVGGWGGSGSSGDAGDNHGGGIGSWGGVGQNESELGK